MNIADATVNEKPITEPFSVPEPLLGGEVPDEPLLPEVLTPLDEPVTPLDEPIPLEETPPDELLLDESSAVMASPSSVPPSCRDKESETPAPHAARAPSMASAGIVRLTVKLVCMAGVNSERQAMIPGHRPP